MGERDRKVAILIDAENVPARVAQKIIDVAMGYGNIVERRIYGDFTRDALRPWIEVFSQHALSPQTTTTTVAGKNSADILLAIDATEMLCKSEVDVFCIASSDSDFTQLAMRIRMRGKHVIGLGSEKSVLGLRAAYDDFIAISLASQPVPKKTAPSIVKTGAVTPSLQKQSATVVPLNPAPDLRPYVARAFELAKHPTDQWLEIARLGSLLRQAHPDFQLKNFGKGKLGSVLTKCAFLETQMHGTNRMQIRLRQSG